MSKSEFYYTKYLGPTKKVSLKMVMELAFLDNANRQDVKNALYTKEAEYFFSDGSRVWRKEV